MTISPKIKLAVWDLDGTIIDSYGVYAAVMAEAAKLSGLPMPDETVIRSNFHGSLDESIKGALDLVDGEAFTTLLNDFLRIQENYYGQPEEHVYADARALAKRLGEHGVIQGVVTNREHQGRGNASPRYLIEHSSLQSVLSFIVCGEEPAQRKPSASVLAHIAAAQELAPAEILVIGDQFVDAQLAHNLGAAAIIVNRSNEPVPHLDELTDSDHITVVSSLDEVTL